MTVVTGNSETKWQNYLSVDEPYKSYWSEDIATAGLMKLASTEMFTKILNPLPTAELH